MGRRAIPNHRQVKISLPNDLIDKVEQHLTGKAASDSITYGVRNELARRLFTSWVKQQEEFEEICQQITEADAPRDLCAVLIRTLLRNSTTQAIGLRAQMKLGQLSQGEG
jgi:hypothetical protein